MAISSPILIAAAAPAADVFSAPVQNDVLVFIAKGHQGTKFPRRELATLTVSEILAASGPRFYPLDPEIVEIFQQDFDRVSVLETVPGTLRFYWSKISRVPPLTIKTIEFDAKRRTFGTLTPLPFPGQDPFIVDARTLGNPNRLYLIYVNLIGRNAFRQSFDLGVTWGDERLIDDINASDHTDSEANLNDPLGERESVQVLQRRIGGISGADAWLSGFSTLAVAPTIFPDNDTIRGGRELTILSTQGLLTDTTEDESFFRTSLPTDFVETVTLSGSSSPTLRGVELLTGRRAGSLAQLATANTGFEHFDVAVDVELVRGPLEPRSEVTLATLDFFIDANTYFEVVVKRGGRQDDRRQAIAFGQTIVTAGEGYVPGNATAFDTGSKFTLRLVRNGARVFGFVGRRDRRTGAYTELVRLIDYERFGAGTGAFRFHVSNDGENTGIRTRFSNMTVRTHMTIDGELIEDKLDFGVSRVVGRVPPTTLDRRGFRDIVVFGLFGENTGVDGFEYTLPRPKSAGNDPVKLFKTFVDPQLRDERGSLDELPSSLLEEE